MNKIEIINKLNKYALDKNEYCILASGALVMMNIKENTNDIDLAVSDKLYNQLLKGHECKISFEYEKNGKKNSIYSFDNIEFGTNFYDKDVIIYIDGYPVLNLETILKHKKDLLHLKRSKDLKDIELINKYLKKSGVDGR